MIKHINLKIKSLLLLIICLLFTNIGLSSFVIISDQKLTASSNYTNKIPVCYIGNKEYLSIERALKDAASNSGSDTIYVIPGTNPTITEDCVVPSGDILCIPYENETWYVDKSTEKNTSFADSTPSTYRQSLVTIANNVTLKNNGTIQIGGHLGLGASQQKPTGHTVGSYSEIQLGTNSKIENNGSLTCYGYIKPVSENNNSELINNASSTSKLPFVIYDFHGGSYSYACNSDNIMPVNIFDFPNVHVKMTYNTNSKLLGNAMLYASSVFTSEPVIVASSGALFNLKSGSISFKYTPSQFNVTTVDTGASLAQNKINYTKVEINGETDFNSLTLSVSSASINTSKMYCPIPYKWDIYINNGGIINLNNKIKFLSGSSLTINQGGTLNVNANTTFYQGYTPSLPANTYPKNLSSAKFINNGTLNLNSGFGGYIQTSLAGATINASSSFTSSVITEEALSSSGSLIFASVDKKDSHTESAIAKISSTDVEPTNTVSLSSNTEYISKGTFFYTPSKDIESIEIVSPNGTTGKADSSHTYDNIECRINPEVNSCTNITYEWSATSGVTFNGTTNQKTVSITVPASSKSWGAYPKASYNLTCTITYYDSSNNKQTKTATLSFTQERVGILG